MAQANRSAPDALFAQPKLANQFTIAVGILLAQVVQQIPAAVNHHEKTAAGMVIFLVRLEMILEIIDPGGQQRYLHFRRTCVIAAAGVFRHDSSLAFFCQSHNIYLSHAATGVGTPHAVSQQK